MKSVCEGGEGSWIEMGTILGEELQNDPYNALRLSELLKEYDTLFSKPHSLPPKRKKDHVIRLQEEVPAPNI